MAKKNPVSETAKRIQRTEAYAEKVRKMFAQTVNDILALNKSIPKLEEGVMFSFDDTSEKMQKEVEDALKRLHSSAFMAIQQGITLEWEQANAECDELVSSIYGEKALSDPKLGAVMQRNTSAMKAFIERTENGMNLSDRVWLPVRQLRDEMEVAMTVAIGSGTSAASMSRTVREYLNDPDLMFRRFRYKDENGKWRRKWKKRIKDETTGKYKWIDYDRDSYKTGAGVYKSSAKNAMRVARTETNIAYRRADNARWQQMDFVLGQKIQLSKNHPVRDICDTLQGVYPVDFVFDGWHPQCFCFVTPVLVDDDEMVKMNEAFINGEDYTPSGDTVKDYPDNFKDWVKDNSDKISAAKQSGKMPYFVQNNQLAIDNILNPKKQLTAKEKAQIRHDSRTDEQKQAIIKAWNDRKATRKYGNSILSYMDGISDVDTSALKKALAGGNSEAILKEAYSLRDIGKEILSYTNLDNPMQVAKQFSKADAKIVNDAVQKKLDEWSGYTLDKQKSKLTFEINWVEQHKKYVTWEVSKKAYIKQLDKVNDAIDWENIGSEFKSMSEFKTKSKPYLDLVEQLDKAISQNNKAEANKLIVEIREKRAQLDKAAAARNKKKVKTQFGDDAYSDERKNAAVWDKGDGQLADDTLIETAGKNWISASKKEKDYIYEYTHHYADVNEPLQGRKYYNSQKKERFIEKVNYMTSYLDRSELPKDMWFTRGDSGLEVIRSRIEFAGGTMPDKLQDLVGMVMQEGGFMSTGSRKGKGFSSREVILNIYAPKGSKAAYLEPISAFGNGAQRSWNGKERFSSFSSEHETLFQRGTQMRITKVYKERGKTYIDCEVIGCDPKDLSYVKDSNIGY